MIINFNYYREKQQETNGLFIREASSRRFCFLLETASVEMRGKSFYQSLSYFPSVFMACNSFELRQIL